MWYYLNLNLVQQLLLFYIDHKVHSGLHLISQFYD
jgi:hypothetical protein